MKFLLKYFGKGIWIFQIVIVSGTVVGDGGHQLLVEIVSHPDGADSKLFFHGDTGYLTKPGGIGYAFIGKTVGDQN